MENLPVIVIGAGPVGLAAAAHLLERGIEPLVLESGLGVAAGVADWGHVRLFSPWRYDVDHAAARLLERHGWTAPPPDEFPTGSDLIAKYLAPLSQVPSLRERVRLGRRVVAITRRGVDKVRTAGRELAPFVVVTSSALGTEEHVGRAVIDASGTWRSPSPLGASGIPAAGEQGSTRIRYGMPDVLGAERELYRGKRTLVAGAGHSAANVILALLELTKEDARTSVVWATRSTDASRVFGGGAADGLPARGKIGRDLAAATEAGQLQWARGFWIEGITESDGQASVRGMLGSAPHVIDGIDRIVAATGQRPDLGFLRELRVSVDPVLESAVALAPLIDPNEHSCGTVRPHGARELAHPEPGLYVIGAKSYGRAPTFLLATGYEQARSVVAKLAGDEAAALRVELDLPETGVCKSDDAEGASCCAPAAIEPSGCCAPSTAPKSACC